MEIDRDVDGADFVRHEPCDKCGSSDANALYTDGSMWCFSCSTYTSGEQEENVTPLPPGQKPDNSLLSGSIKELRARKIDDNLNMSKVRLSRWGVPRTDSSDRYLQGQAR